MKYVDYYQTLGVARDATQEQINKAFRSLAKKFHPDVNKSPGAEERFKQASEAYEVLKDPEKRKKYDALGANWKTGESFRPPPGFENFQFHFGPGQQQGQGRDFSDFFQSLFGGFSGGRNDGVNFDFDELFENGAGRSRRRTPRGRDLESEILIGLEDVVHGSKKTVQLSDGNGLSRTYTVSIPAGIEDGQRIRLPGEGAGNEGHRGDLYLRVRIAEHPSIKRVGSNLEMDLLLAPWEAVLGAKKRVETPDGAVEIAVPAGMSSGKRLRLKGRGITKAGNGEAGDLYLVARIVVNENLSQQERELYEKLKQISETGS